MYAVRTRGTTARDPVRTPDRSKAVRSLRAPYFSTFASELTGFFVADVEKCCCLLPLSHSSLPAYNNGRILCTSKSLTIPMAKDFNSSMATVIIFLVPAKFLRKAVGSIFKNGIGTSSPSASRYEQAINPWTEDAPLCQRTTSFFLADKELSSQS